MSCSHATSPVLRLPEQKNKACIIHLHKATTRQGTSRATSSAWQQGERTEIDSCDVRVVLQGCDGNADDAPLFRGLVGGLGQDT